MQISEMRKWIKENASRYKDDRDKLINDCVEKFNRSRKRIGNLIGEMRQAGELPNTAFIGLSGPKSKGSPAAVEKAVPSRGLSATKGKPFRMSVDISEIAKEYDDDGKIEEGISSLGTHLIKDNDFRLELGVSYERWKIVSNQPKFANNKQELKGKRFRGLYWGAVPVIRELRKKIDLL